MFGNLFWFVNVYGADWIYMSMNVKMRSCTGMSLVQNSSIVNYIHGNYVIFYIYLCILQDIVWYLHDEQGREKLWDGDKCSWRVRHLLMLFAWGFNTKYSLHTNVWEKSLHFKSPLLRPQRPLQMTRFNAKCRPAWMIIYFLYLFVLRRNN